MYQTTYQNETGSRKVIISANSETGPFTSRLYVGHGEIATSIVKTAKTLTGAHKQARRMLRNADNA